MKLEQHDATRICRLVVDHGLDTRYVAERCDISRRRVQQLAREYRETEEIPQLQTPGRTPYAEYPPDLVERILELYHLHQQGAAAIAHMLRQRDGLSIDNKRVHEILQEYETVTENPRKQGRRRPWVRWERDYSLVTVHMDWFQNSRNQWCLAVEDDASRKILGMIEQHERSGEKTVQLLDEVRAETAEGGEILEVITDHGSEFYASRRDQDGNADHAFEGISPTTRSSRRSVRSVGQSRMGRSNASSRPTRSSAGGSSLCRNSLTITTITGHTRVFDTTS